MKNALFTAMLCIAAFAAAAAEPVKIIFDTDMCGDYDDVGALAILHALADAGEAEILATVVCVRESRAAAVCEIINHYYGRPGIPVGCTRGIGDRGLGADGYGLLPKYPGLFKYAMSSDAPDATEVYRKALAAQPDRSVVICSVGFISNLRKLIESKPDAISPLDGLALVNRKVKLWVAMACSYPNGRECNSMTDWESSAIAFDSWPTPIVFSDFQYGWTVKAGRAIAEADIKGSPVKDAFARMLTPRSRLDPNNKNPCADDIAGHPSWDETAVLAAVRGVDKYFSVERGRYAMTGNKGDDFWTPSTVGPHMRIVEKTPKAEVGKIIDELMLRPPRLGK